MEREKKFDFMLEIDKFFEDYERNSKNFKLFVDFEDIEAAYESKPFNMDNLSIKLKKPEKSKSKINIKRNKNIISNKNTLF